MLSNQVKKTSLTIVKVLICLILLGLLFLTAIGLSYRYKDEKQSETSTKLISEIAAENFVDSHIFRTHFSEPKTHLQKLVLYAHKLPVFEGTTLHTTIEFLNEAFGPWYQARRK